MPNPRRAPCHSSVRSASPVSSSPARLRSTDGRSRAGCLAAAARVSNRKARRQVQNLELWSASVSFHPGHKTCGVRVGNAVDRFVNLTDAEDKLLMAATAGTFIDLRVGDTEVDDVARGINWGTGRHVRAGLLVEMLTETGCAAGKVLRSIKLRGARITGTLDLEATSLICPLQLLDCYFDEPVNLDEATARTIRLPGCRLPGFTAKQLVTTGNLELNDGFTADGPVSLADARVGGALNLSGGRFMNHAGDALNADGIAVEQGMFCMDGFIADGRVNLWSAHVGGQLNFKGGQLINPGGRALNARQLTVGESMFCMGGFTAEGEVHLLGARIGGALDLTDGQFTNPGGDALSAQWLTIEHGMLCQDGFTARGEVRIEGASIGGQLSLTGGQFINPGRTALDARQLTVGQSMYCGAGFIADGEVNLIGAHVGRALDLDGGHFSNPGAIALHADRITVEQAMLCRDGFVANGQVRLLRAKIDGWLNFTGASLNNPGGKALDLRASDVEELILRPAQAPDGIVDLTNTHVGVYYDDQPTWPIALRLRGFTYETLQNDQISIRDRMRWLARHIDGYTPQVYDQLSAAYRRAGDEEAARRVGIRKQWRRRSPYNPLNWLLYATVGYGYRTWLAAAWLVILLLLGSRAFTVANAHHLMQADPNAPAFHPIAYTLDLILPVVNLGQRVAFTPRSWALYWSWALIGAGWILTTAVIAALTGILKRD
jgi:hypothetical protein